MTRRKNATDAHPGLRHARLSELLLEELRATFRDDVFDPAFANLEVRAVVLSIDFRSARVHYAVRGEAESVAPELEAIARRLPRLLSFLRARAVEALELRRAPELHFVCDGVMPRGALEPAEHGAAREQVPAVDGSGSGTEESGGRADGAAQTCTSPLRAPESC
jgi:ribosome-binding factor A